MNFSEATKIEPSALVAMLVQRLRGRFELALTVMSTVPALTYRLPDENFVRGVIDGVGVGEGVSEGDGVCEGVGDQEGVGDAEPSPRKKVAPASVTLESEKKKKVYEDDAGRVSTAGVVYPVYRGETKPSVATERKS